MNSTDLKEVIDNVELPTCTLLGHQQKELTFVCLDSACEKCSARGSKLLCPKCMLAESHYQNIEEIKDFIMANSLQSNANGEEFLLQEQGNGAKPDANG